MMDEYVTKGDQARAYMKANPDADVHKFHADTGLAKSWWYYIRPKQRVARQPKRERGVPSQTHVRANILEMKRKELLEAPEHVEARRRRKEHVEAMPADKVAAMAQIVGGYKTALGQALIEYISLYPENDFDDVNQFFTVKFAKSGFHAARRALLPVMGITPVRKKYVARNRRPSLDADLDAAIRAAAESLVPTEMPAPDVGRPPELEKTGRLRVVPGPVLEKLMAEAGVPFPPQARQVGGDHYTKKAIQPWEAIEAWVQSVGFEAYLHGNIIKYVARYPDKGGIEDLKKAAHYIERLVEHLERCK